MPTPGLPCSKNRRPAPLPLTKSALHMPLDISSPSLFRRPKLLASDVSVAFLALSMTRPSIMLSSNSGSDKFRTCTVSILGQYGVIGDARSSCCQETRTPDSCLENKRLDFCRAEEVLVAAELVVILRDDEVVIVKQRHQPCLSLLVLTLLVLAEHASTVVG